MWLEAVDLVLARLRDKGTLFEGIRGVSGSGQQHGSVYWGRSGEAKLGGLGEGEWEGGLVEGLDGAFAHPWSPNWQDASTQRECDEFDEAVGGEEVLARITGSRAHHVGSWIPFFRYLFFPYF